ncbi:hypothetical protein BKA66DRAFT_575230 [Pyrenochaeta sp. MPI-SDFR-AT-0127]|nr:hypothetical protein BKA66DRAFT_575230 [Pyrenochaeta sp. MPI-SDFR-AT-0127]
MESKITQHSAKPRISAKNASIATVLVGPQKDRFHIHKDLLTHYSPFFRAALSGNFKEAEEHTVTLPEECPKTFEYFVHWLYNQRLPDEDDATEFHEQWSSPTDDGEMKTGSLIHLYVLCDKYSIPQLKIAATNELFDHVHRSTEPTNLPEPEHVEFAFSQLDEKSGLCRFLVDMYCFWGDMEQWDALRDAEFPKPFLFKVLSQYSTVACGGPQYPEAGIFVCKYHEHKTGREQHDCSRTSWG